MLKKILLTTCVLLLTLNVSWGAEKTKTPPTIVECEFIPIFRGNPDHNAEKKHFSIQDGTSDNWSGYAALSNLSHPATSSVSKVVGSWIVPSVSATPNDAYSSIWVGIDGYASNSVEQLGTDQDWIGGSPQYYAWFEMFPKNAFLISGFTVEPGDEITAKVIYKGKGVFSLSIQNLTKNIIAKIPTKKTISKTAKRSSAEWIVEAPSSNQGVLPLANFDVASLFNCSCTIGGISGPINSNHWQNDKITMQHNNIVKAIPSDLTNGTDFTVAWNHE